MARIRLIFMLACGFLSGMLSAQCAAGFSSGKGLGELRTAIKVPSQTSLFFAQKPLLPMWPSVTGSHLNTDKHPDVPGAPFLPKWSAADLPFFCKIEHDWAKQGRVPVKFRLGSVEYVDWLEGKGVDHRPANQ